MRSYDHTKIEKKWQKEWTKKKLHVTKDTVKGKKNFYLLVEFPYPSGNLHVGHWYAFAVPDILARHYRMQGRNVLYPIGFDAFGLPAENAAIKNNINPKKWTYSNIAYMEKQIESMGTSFDWSRKVVTADPEYYKWTQWLFLQFFKKGLAYKKETAVNWCPKDKTVLANEQVTNGKCERCDSEVEQRNMLQWNLKITDYADRLDDDLTALDWPEQIKASQRNWIGRSEGAEIDFPLEFEKKDSPKPNYLILHGYTGRADRNFIPWLKRELVSRGFDVQTPQMPNTDFPKESEQVPYVLQNCKINERTIIVGHSLGAIVALKALLKHNQRIAGLVLVAPAMGPADKADKPFKTTFTWDFDFDAVKRLSGFRLLHSDTLEPHRSAYVEDMAKRLDAPVITSTAKRTHFTAIEEPAILKSLQPSIRVFTTRPDTLFGATYLVLSPEHPWVTLAIRDDHKGVLKNQDEVKKYVAAAGKKTELERQENKEKTGVKLEGVDAINPATGEKIPLYVADYVLAHYGTGAIMAVPAHDERDAEFAQKFEIPVREVVIAPENAKKPYTGMGVLLHSGEFDGMSSDEAKEKMMEKFGIKKTTYKMRDWVVSRQRYWGVPIPVIDCPKCGDVAVPDKDLPVKLPDVKDYLPSGDGKSPLAKVTKFVHVKCPQCKGKAKRETDTFDTFVDSSWYFQRYTDPKNKNKFADAKKLATWMPIDLYSGGAEHTTMHVLYSRFWQKAMYDLGLVKDNEPYTRRMNRSLIMGPDGQKMSKSRGNVIDPDEVVKNLGADTVRMYLAFIGPYNEVASYPWNPSGVVGVRRFLERVWRLQYKLLLVQNPQVERPLHFLTKKMTEDLPQQKFNTAIAAMMTFLNEADSKGITKAQYFVLLRLLAPFAPHMSEELWRAFGNKKSIHLENWPQYDPKKVASEFVTIVVQINGKVRAQFQAQTGEVENEVRTSAEKAAAKWLEGKEVKKAILVPNRLINFVI